MYLTVSEQERNTILGKKGKVSRYIRFKTTEKPQEPLMKLTLMKPDLSEFPFTLIES